MATTMEAIIARLAALEESNASHQGDINQLKCQLDEKVCKWEWEFEQMGVEHDALKANIKSLEDKVQQVSNISHPSKSANLFVDGANYDSLVPTGDHKQCAR
jgi:hypothetical protein